MRIFLAMSLVVLTSLCFLRSVAAYGNAFQESDPEAKELIRKNLSALQEKYQGRHFDSDTKQKLNDRFHKILKLYGFDSLSQLAKALIGDAFPIYFIRLDKLRDYAGADPFSLIEQKSVFIYPLIVENQARSSAIVSFLQKEKEALNNPRIELGGNVDLIRRVEEARKVLREEGYCLNISDCFVVSIPALRLHLFGYRDEIKGLQIVTLNTVRGHVKKEDYQNAKDLITTLSNDAQVLRPLDHDTPKRGREYRLKE